MPIVDEKNTKKMDKQLRITLTDLNDFGFSERCPRCEDLQAGIYGTKKVHGKECRFRIYLNFKKTNHPRRREVKHLLEPEDKFDAEHVDVEGAEVIPQAMDGSNVLGTDD